MVGCWLADYLLPPTTATIWSTIFNSISYNEHHYFWMLIPMSFIPPSTSLLLDVERSPIIHSIRDIVGALVLMSRLFNFNVRCARNWSKTHSLSKYDSINFQSSFFFFHLPIIWQRPGCFFSGVNYMKRRIKRKGSLMTEDKIYFVAFYLKYNNNSN